MDVLTELDPQRIAADESSGHAFWIDLFDPSDEKVEQIQVEPGSSVVGRGEKLGEVYKLSDGRTVIVKPKGATDSTGP